MKRNTETCEAPQNVSGYNMRMRNSVIVHDGIWKSTWEAGESLVPPLSLRHARLRIQAEERSVVLMTSIIRGHPYRGYSNS